MVLDAVIGPVAAWGDLPEVPLPDVDLAPEDEATLFYTSGATGAAKGVIGTHLACCTTIFSQMFARARTYVRRGGTPPVRDASSPQLSHLLTAPLFHTTGCQAILVPVFYDGSKLAMLRRWDCEAAMKMIERERITSTGGVPTIALQLLEHPRRADYDLSSLLSISYGGAPAPADLAGELRRTFPAVAVCDMKIVGEDGREPPRGEVGELWGKGPNVAKGYWRQPEANADTFTDGWLRTGDLAYIDEEGFLFIVGRAKDIIIRGGENILCAEVERALMGHPAVMDAAVAPVANPTLGEEPAAVINLHAGATVGEDALKVFVAERLASFKVPVRIVFADALLPRNPAGKLDKPTIARQLA